MLASRRVRAGIAATLAVVVVAGVAGGVVAATSGGGGLPANAAFSVAGHAVTVSDFNSELQVRQTLYGIQPPATTDTVKYASYTTDAAQAEAVSLLLDQVAPSQGITVSSQTAQASLDSSVSSQYGGDKAKFAAALGAVGLNQSQLLTEVTHNLVYQRLFAKIVGTPTPSQADIQAYFDQHTAALQVPETRQVSHIVVSSQATAQSIVDQVKAGTAFASLAGQSLDTTTKAGGGALGNYAKADLQAEFGTAAFNAQANVPFGPVQESGGWDVGLVSVVNPGRAAALDAKTVAGIKTILLDQAQATSWTTWLSGQIAKAKIIYAAKYRPAHPEMPPQIPIPQLNGETLAGVGPAKTATSTPSGSGATGSGSSSSGATSPAPGAGG